MQVQGYTLKNIRLSTPHFSSYVLRKYVWELYYVSVLHCWSFAYSLWLQYKSYEAKYLVSLSCPLPYNV